MVLDLRKLQQRLENKDPESLYLLIGEETFLVQEAIALLKKKVVDPGLMDFNCDVFDASETSSGQVKDAAEMLPVMTSRRLVVYRGVDDLKEKDWDVLFPLFDRPVESTTFVLTCETLDKRKKPFKKLSDASVIVE